MKYIYFRELKLHITDAQIYEISSKLNSLPSSFLGASADVVSNDLKLFFLCESIQDLASIIKIYSVGQLIKTLKCIIDTILNADTRPIIDDDIIQSSFEDCGRALGE